MPPARPFAFLVAQRIRAATSTTKISTLRLLLEKPTPPLLRSAKTESGGALPATNAPLRRRRVGPRASTLGGFLGFEAASQEQLVRKVKRGRRRF